MKIVITGGTGFLGRMLARRLLARGTLIGPSGEPEAIDELLLFDATEPAAQPAGLDERARLVIGNIVDREQVTRLFDRDDVSVFHLASVLSGGGEQDFDAALRVNLQGTLNVLEACRAGAGRPRLVFASSLAVFGGALPATVGDGTKQTPQTTYGTTKAIGELLVNDYTRKGFLDGRSARLPTVIIRPGTANLAASSFASALIREPLAGRPCRLPVGPEVRMPVIGYRAAVENLIALHEAEGSALGADRAVGLPSLDVSVQDMIEALQRVAGERPLGAITFAPDPAIERIVASWPQATDSARARALGLACEASLDAIVEAYIEDFLAA